MKHPISITVINNSVGIPQSTDGIMGMFVRAVAVTGTFDLNKGYLITSLDDLADLGIDADYDVTNSTAVYEQVSDFYAVAGDGALLWLFGVPTNTAYATYVAASTFDTLIRSTAIADPANRVKMIGLCYDIPATLQTAADFPADVTAAIIALETKRILLFNQGYQFSAIIDGYNMSSTVSVASLATMATKAAPGVSLCVTSLRGNGVSAVGFALGRFARISIGHGFGAVEDGPMNTSSAYLTNGLLVTADGTLVVGHVYTVTGGTVVYNTATYAEGTTFTAITGHTTFTTPDTGYVLDNATPASKLSPSDIDQLGQKQFLFLRTWFGHSGFYWNDGATCEDPTKILSTQENNRVANALAADALSFFIDQMGKNLPVDTSTGAVSQAYLNAKQAIFDDTYIEPLLPSGTGDISGGALTLSAPNFNATKTMNFTLSIVASTILGGVSGTIQFTATL